MWFHFSPLQVLPIIMKNQPVPSKTVLNCRLLNKWTKNSVDEAIYRRPPWGHPQPSNSTKWVEDSIFFKMEQIQNFNARAEGFVGNPFMHKTVWIAFSEILEEEIRLALDILQRFGHEIWTLHLELQILEPIPFFQQLSQAMNCIPNIRHLNLLFPPIEADDQIWHDFQIPPNCFPALEGLKTLGVYSGIRPGDVVPAPPSVVRPLLVAYGEQLTRLTLEPFVLQGDQWESFRLPNLAELEVHFAFDEEGHAEIYNNMKELDCPQLKTLKLHGNIVFTQDLVLVLNAFRESLVELYINGQVDLANLFQVDPLAIQEIPKLVRLTLRAEDVDSQLWHIFRTLFPNLQDLVFLGWAAEEMTVNRRRRFFTIFPRLKRLLWIANDADDKSEVVGPRTIVYTRESIY